MGQLQPTTLDEKLQPRSYDNRLRISHSNLRDHGISTTLHQKTTLSASQTPFAPVLAFAINITYSCNQSEMCNPFKSLFPNKPPDTRLDIIREGDDAQPPRYMERPRLYPSTCLRHETKTVLSLKRCLIWRMAVDWDLERHVPKAERPNVKEYSSFEECCKSFCEVLGDHYQSQQQLKDVKNHLMTTVFIPGNHLGIGSSRLSFILLCGRLSSLTCLQFF